MSNGYSRFYKGCIVLLAVAFVAATGIALFIICYNLIKNPLTFSENLGDKLGQGGLITILFIFTFKTLNKLKELTK